MERFSAVLVALALMILVGAPAARATAMEKVGNYLLPVESGEIEGAGTAVPKKCDVVVVGGGCGGIYSGYRLLSGSTVIKPTVCTFEATNRVGGRIFSIRGLGKYADMTVDLGAYRYVDGRHTLVQGLVENLLKLKYVLYDPSSTTFRKIVDDKGDDLGFVTFVEELAKLSMSLGMKLFLNSPVTKVDRMPSTSSDTQYSVSVMGPGGKVMKVVAKHVIFNVPQRPLMRILQNSNLARITDWNPALDMPFPLMAAKMYLYYDDAWWVYMNRLNGTMNDPNTNNATTFNSSSLFITPPLRGRYHDGDWKCNADNSKCHGMLMYTYASDNGGTFSRGGQGLDISPYNGVVPRFYWNYAVNPDPSKPYVVLDMASNSGKNLIMAAHKKVVDYHIGINVPIPEPYASTYPSQAVVVVWDPQIHWTGGAWHSYKNGIFGSAVSTNYSDPRNAVPVASIKPFAGENIWVANEAFSAVQGWAEGSLIMAENVVTQMGAAAPTFISPERHACVLHPTYNYNATLCALSLNPLVQGVTRRSAAAAASSIALATLQASAKLASGRKLGTF
ncbi:hypothetical protein HYH02_008541 [Chlamydomonas schloesseri]|uniref:Amine oxidase domain-containing protein n=1 Tax=Chlamydomonas schloesseri TaxID=2026947 RepID=A0A835WG05_9CHLO|nr:hypothetical protein HYH02_008541 [Chlamydomonas schloesseri]|eukprot:KAG2446554.1 hypothetical protein HYH02_008541 [Chlamydomonas schloesseri]